MPTVVVEMNEIAPYAAQVKSFEEAVATLDTLANVPASEFELDPCLCLVSALAHHVEVNDADVIIHCGRSNTVLTLSPARVSISEVVLVGANFAHVPVLEANFSVTSSEWVLGTLEVPVNPQAVVKRLVTYLVAEDYEY